MTTNPDLFDATFWKHYLLDTFLHHWHTHSLDHRFGGFIADFDRTWAVCGPGNKSLVSQSRLVYTFAAGLRHTGQSDFARASGHGVAFLTDHMADRQQGGFLWRVHQDGSPLEPLKHTYGHAFTIFGLSEYARATGQTDAADTARRTLAILHEKAAGPSGGFLTLMDRDWQPTDRKRSQNPHMHLLEACLSLYDVTADPLAIDTALQIATLAAEKFINPRFGCLEEYFAQDWSLFPDESAGPLQTGHQFEWCWLLHRLADRTHQQHWRQIGDQLMDWALRYGTDSHCGGFHNTCTRSGVLVDTEKNHWVQSEALRTLLYQIVSRRRDDLRDLFTTAATFALNHLADAQYGGWYTQVSAAGAPTHPGKGSEWKLDYHMTSLCDEALRLLRAGNPRS